MTIQVVDPTDVSNWDRGLLERGGIDFFHSSVWAKVLKESYGYRPLYFTSHEDGRLVLSMPMMEVRSVWTGKRGTSLPFTDQCTPFFLDREVLSEAVGRCLDYGRRAGWRHVDWRAADYYEDNPPAWAEYYAHEIALSKDEAELFARFHPGNRRNIRKAAGERLSIEFSASWPSLVEFCRLNVLTRRRHGLPPQPPRFFEKVFEHVLSTGHGMVVSARHDGRTIASSIYFQFGKKALFKYGASELDRFAVRPNNLIMWEAVRWYRAHGFEKLSLGRTDLDAAGLLRYKRAWGAEERRLRYYRYEFRKGGFLTHKQRRSPYRGLIANLPSGILRTVGRIAYRHMA